MPHRTGTRRRRRQPRARTDVLELRKEYPEYADWIYHTAEKIETLRNRLRRQTEVIWTPVPERLQNRIVSYRLWNLPDSYVFHSCVRITGARFQHFEYVAYVAGTFRDKQWRIFRRYPYGIFLSIPNGIVHQGAYIEGPTLGFLTVRRVMTCNDYLLLWVPIPLIPADSDIPPIPLQYCRCGQDLDHPRLVIMKHPLPDVLSPIDYGAPLYGSDPRRMIIEETFHGVVGEIPGFPSEPDLHRRHSFTPPSSHNFTSSFESQSTSHSQLSYLN